MFKDILSELGELHAAKSHDYARADDVYRNFRMNTEVWGTIDWQEPLKRATEKMIRISELTSGDKEPNNESIEDSIKDIAVLAVIALDMYRGNK